MNNLTYTLRQLRKSPNFTFVAVLTLALGIGANTAIFTVVHAVLLSPLPYPDADRLVAVQSRNFQENLTGQPFAPAGFREFEKQVTSFESIAASRYNYDNLTNVEKPTSLTASLVTQEYFRVLGEKAFVGRTFTVEDATPNAKPTAVLSYDLWQKQFGGSEIIGKNITVNDVPTEVIGVMPRTFKDPFNIPSIWRVFPTEGGENSLANARAWGVIGRTKSAVPASTIQAELSTVAARFAQSDPKFYKGWDFSITPLRELVVGNYRDGLLLVVGAALLVLLITCANVAGLQFVRASTRQREVAIRLALGATRSAIARSHLIESLLLVTLGGIGGVLIGSWGLDLLLASFSRDWIPRGDEIVLNTTVLATTGVTALVTGIVFGLFPAWHATRVDAIDSLRDGSKGSSGLQSVRLRGALVIAQIALTLVLLVCTCIACLRRTGLEKFCRDHAGESRHPDREHAKHGAHAFAHALRHRTQADRLLQAGPRSHCRRAWRGIGRFYPNDAVHVGNSRDVLCQWHAGRHGETASRLLRFCEPIVLRHNAHSAFTGAAFF
ncbi:MAG: hypothetical protein DMF04_04245 [Verrucomicrobia bacterium]|nr:MAG: hypothetical protein DMF04_04245 [Verrucomicrobiota bacterium]